MSKFRMMACGLVFVASFFGAAPALGDDDPEPRRPVYHMYYVRITGDKLSVEQMRKLFPTLKLAKVQLKTTDDEYARHAKNGQNSRQYLVYVRSRDSSRASFDKVHDVIKGTKGVEEIYVPVDLSKRTVDRLP
jgi:hypothetical protein